MAVVVQHHQVDVTADGQTFTLPSPVADMTRAFVRVTNNRMVGAGDVDAPTQWLDADDLSVGVYLTATDTVTFRRLIPTPAFKTRVTFEIREFVGNPGDTDEFIVRSRNEVDLTSTNLGTDPLDVAPTNRWRCIPYITGVLADDSTDSANAMAVAAWVSGGPEQINVDVGVNSAVAKTAFVTTVEYLGSDYIVGHGRVDAQTADSGTINLVTDADGLAGTTVDVLDWANATIEAWGHKGDDTNQNQADNWPGLTPGANTTSVAYLFSDDHVGASDSIMVHVLGHPQMAVTRYSLADVSGVVSQLFDVTSAGLTDLTKASVYGTASVGGAAVAYARGWRNFRFTSLTEVEAWCHRTGAFNTYEVQVVDWTAVTGTPGGPGTDPGGLSFDTHLFDPVMGMVVPASIKVHDGAALADGRVGPVPDPPPTGGYNPANYVPPPDNLTTYPDPTDQDISPYVFFSETVPQARLTTSLFQHSSRNTALTSSNQVAGKAFSDPLVRPGVPNPPNHSHVFLGNVLAIDADIEDLPNEPIVWQPGTHADTEQLGFPGLLTDLQGNKFGYAPGVWWPEIFWNPTPGVGMGQPVTHGRGIATYYVRLPNVHDGHRVFLLPNGAGYVTSIVSLNETANDFRMSVRGPNWFHEDIHVGPFPEINANYNDPYIDFGPTMPAGGGWYAAANFQTYLKFAKPAGINSLADLNGGHLDPRFTYGSGDPQSPVAFHLDYVSGWTDYNFAQELLDRCCNVNKASAAGNIKFEAWRGTFIA